MANHYFLTEDEWNPIMGIIVFDPENLHLGLSYPLVEVPLTLATRYEMALTEFLEVQTLLRELQPAAKTPTWD